MKNTSSDRPIVLRSYPCTPRRALVEIRPVFDSLLTLKVSAAFHFARHQHVGFEVVAVERGKYHCALNGMELVLEPGNLLVVKPGDWHEDFCAPPLRCYTLRFHLEQPLSKAASSIFVETVKPHQQYLRPPRKMWPLLAQIEKEHRCKDWMADHIQDALLHEFFWLLLRQLPSDVIAPTVWNTSQDQSFVTRLTRLFRSKREASFSISEMAKAMGMSQSSLAHKCKTLLGKPPRKMFTQCKIDEARALLKGTAMSVKEISSHLGFENPFYFSKVYKKHTGNSPSGSR